MVQRPHPIVLHPCPEGGIDEHLHNSCPAGAVSGLNMEQGMKPSSTLVHINVETLFNLPLYEHHLVIDARSGDEYASGHIVSAVSYPSPERECSDQEREKTLIKFIKSYVKEYFRPENPSPIVVYGNSTPECIAHINWLASKLELLKKDRKILAKIDPPSHGDKYELDDYSEDKPFDYFQHFCHTIADGAKEIWILDDGYEAFKKEYPFLCGHVDWSSMFPLPHQVNRNLFLGTRVFPLEKDCLRKLEVTHVIVSEFQKINWRELDGISVLRCSVKDDNDQPMLPCWKACYQFITEALAADLPNLADLRIPSSPCQSTSLTASSSEVAPQLESADGNEVAPQLESADRNESISVSLKPSRGVRILVLLHGRSRSSSVILAYLIKACRMKFSEAWTYLCSKCWHIIDQSLVYVDQLKQWEQTELASIEEL